MKTKNVSRTISILKCNVLVYDEATKEVTEHIVITPEINEKKVGAVIQENLNSGLSLVKILTTEKVSEKYYMTVSDFMRYGKAASNNKENEEEG